MRPSISENTAFILEQGPAKILIKDNVNSCSAGSYHPDIVQFQVFYSRILGHGPIQAICTQPTHNHNSQLTANDIGKSPV